MVTQFPDKLVFVLEIGTYYHFSSWDSLSAQELLLNSINDSQIIKWRYISFFCSTMLPSAVVLGAG